MQRANMQIIHTTVFPPRRFPPAIKWEKLGGMPTYLVVLPLLGITKDRDIQFLKQETLNGVGPVTAWPALESNGPLQRLEKEASYSVKFAKGDDAWQYVPNTLEDYVRFSPGAAWMVKVNHAGSVWPLKEER